MTNGEIASIREGLGKTRHQFASILKTTAMTVGRWERGLVKPSPVFVEKLEELKKFLEGKESEHMGNSS